MTRVAAMMTVLEKANIKKQEEDIARNMAKIEKLDKELAKMDVGILEMEVHCLHQSRR